jgi:hypothetical protein
MSKDNDDRKKRERDDYNRRKAERWAAILVLQNEKFTLQLVNSLTAEEYKTLLANKEGFADYVNNVLYAAPKPPEK